MVYLFLAEGFEEIEALCPLDLLRRAGVEAATVSVTENNDVTGAHGITVNADMVSSEAMQALLSGNKPEMIILPGGMPGTKNLDASPVVHSYIDESVDNGSYIAAICAAPSILGKMNLLNGRKATCYPGFEKYLTGAEVGGRVVRDGNFITACGMGAAHEFGLELISVLKGSAAAEKIKASVLA